MEKENHSLIIKIFAFIFTAIIIATPLYELIPGLEPVGFYNVNFQMSCILSL